jgi:hypothetical protein
MSVKKRKKKRVKSGPATVRVRGRSVKFDEVTKTFLNIPHFKIGKWVQHAGSWLTVRVLFPA